MKRALAVTAVIAASWASGCESSPPADGGAHISDVLPLGKQYDSPAGSFCVISLQDEYRLIRAVSAGPIARGYEDVFTVTRDSVKFNRWMHIEKAPGLELAIVSPTEVAFRFEGAGGEPK